MDAEPPMLEGTYAVQGPKALLTFTDAATKAPRELSIPARIYHLPPWLQRACERKPANRFSKVLAATLIAEVRRTRRVSRRRGRCALREMLLLANWM